MKKVKLNCVRSGYLLVCSAPASPPSSPTAHLLSNSHSVYVCLLAYQKFLLSRCVLLHLKQRFRFLPFTWLLRQVERNCQSCWNSKCPQRQRWSHTINPSARAASRKARDTRNVTLYKMISRFRSWHPIITARQFELGWGSHEQELLVEDVYVVYKIWPEASLISYAPHNPNDQPVASKWAAVTSLFWLSLARSGLAWNIILFVCFCPDPKA